MNDFIELLNVVTTDSRDNGEEFTVTNRISVIEKLLETTDYKLVVNEPLVRLYSKRDICEGDSVVLVSSHVDSLYGLAFVTMKVNFCEELLITVLLIPLYCL